MRKWILIHISSLEERFNELRKRFCSYWVLDLMKLPSLSRFSGGGSAFDKNIRQKFKKQSPWKEGIIHAEDLYSFHFLTLFFFFLSGVSSCQQWRRTEVNALLWGLQAKCMIYPSSGAVLDEFPVSCCHRTAVGPWLHPQSCMSVTPNGTGRWSSDSIGSSRWVQ